MGHTVEQKCCDSGTFWMYLLVIVGLLLFSGLMSGLTLGLMSLGLVDLEVIKRSGKPEDRKHAEKIVPVVRRQHLLLVTLLVGNAMAMEALPLFLDSLVDTWVAIILSVTLLLMFGEILPQAVCSRHGLAVGATMAPVVKILLFIMFPIAWPVSKLLDKLLGSKHNDLFGRAELKTLVDMHGNEAGNGGELSRLETKIISGALDLAEKTAGYAMTPTAAIFSIDLQSQLDDKMILSVLASGYSRIPVYSEKPNNIIGYIFVKDFLNASITKRSCTELPIIDVPITKIPRVSEDMPLYDVFSEFRHGRSYMAAVVRSSNSFHDEEKEPNIQVAVDVLTETTDSEFETVDFLHPDDKVEAKRTTVTTGQEERSSGKGSTLNFEIGGDEEGDIIGIITREDLLAELLMEESLDEPDCKRSFRESPGTIVSLPTLHHHPPSPASQLQPRFTSLENVSLPSVSPRCQVSGSPLSNASASPAAPQPGFSDSAYISYYGSPDNGHRAVPDCPPRSSSAPSSPIRGLGSKRGVESMNLRNHGRHPLKSSGVTQPSNLTSRVIILGQESSRPISRQVAVHMILHSKD